MKIGDLVTNRWRTPLVGVIVEFTPAWRNGELVQMPRVFWADGGTTREFTHSIWRVNESG